MRWTYVIFSTVILDKYFLKVADLMRKFCAVAELANKQLEKIEESTEKTPSQELVWPQVTNIF